jgi:hypothetical protein
LLSDDDDEEEEDDDGGDAPDAFAFAATAAAIPFICSGLNAIVFFLSQFFVVVDRTKKKAKKKR